MAITPITVARVSHNLRTRFLTESLRTNTLDLFREQIKLTTGLKFLRPSEDPVSATQAIKLSEIAEQQDQIVKNLQFADQFLSQTDSTLNEIHSLLIEAESLASENVNSITSQDEREAAAIVIDSIISQLIGIGNRQFLDMYQFAGFKIDQPPFVEDYPGVGGIRYDGDDGDLLSRVAFEHLEAFNLTGDALFGSLSSKVSGFVDLNPALSTSTRLEDLNGAFDGTVTTGVIEIVDSSVPVTLSVDLTGADTVGDIVDIINDTSTQNGASIVASATATGLQLAGAGTIEVRDIGNSATAAQLGILTTPAAPSPIIGQDLDPRLTQNTPLAALNGGVPIDLASGIRIENGQKVATVNFAAASTVQDLLNIINGAGVGVRAEINDAGTGIDVINLVSGAELSIGENGGTTATDLGIRSYYAGSLLGDFNSGAGVESLNGQIDFTIHDANGISIDVDVSGATTVQDVLTRINAAAAGAGSTLTASLAAVGNGITLSHPASGTQNITIERKNLSFAIDDLGLSGVTGTTQTLTSTDVNRLRVESVFSTLIDLRDALRLGDEQAITDAGSRLNAQMVELNNVHGAVGSRSLAIRTRLEFTEEAVLATQKLLSEAKDLDYTTAVTEFQQAQTALQANLLTGTQLLEISLLDFL